MRGRKGEGFATYSDYSIPGSFVHRLFLPLIAAVEAEGCEDDLSTSPWGPLAQEAGLILDARVECAAVVGWGRGNGREPSFLPSQGRATTDVIGAIKALLMYIHPADDNRWQFNAFGSFDERGGVCQDVNIGRDEFFDMWRDAPMPGTLRLADEVMIDAPRYADSVILSATEDLTEISSNLGLEVVRASPRQPIPDMTW